MENTQTFRILDEGRTLKKFLDRITYQLQQKFFGKSVSHSLTRLTAPLDLSEQIFSFGSQSCATADARCNFPAKVDTIRLIANAALMKTTRIRALFYYCLLILFCRTNSLLYNFLSVVTTDIYHFICQNKLLWIVLCFFLVFK